MTPCILITGGHHLLASWLSACWLARPGTRVLRSVEGADSIDLAELEESVRDILGRSDTVRAAEVTACLQSIAGGGEELRAAISPLPPMDVWYLAGRTSSRPRWRHDLGAVRRWFAALTPAARQSFTFVTEEQDPPVAELSELCRAAGVDLRVVTTARVLGEWFASLESTSAPWPRFLSALHELKGEVQDRLPEYFDHQALRLRVRAEDRIRLVSAEVAAAQMSDVGSKDAFLGTCHHIAGVEIRVADLCECLGEAYDVGLLAVDGPDSLNPVDLLLEARLEALEDLFKPAEPCRLDPGEDARAALGRQLKSIRCRQDVLRAARDERAAVILGGALGPRSVGRGAGKLEYYAGGPGDTPVVIVNALGQGLEYWRRLLERLVRRRRVIVWELRSTGTGGLPLRTGDQVDDLEAILRQEAVTSCHLVGWCTGPKVAVELHLRRPDIVASMVFLNATFRNLGDPETLGTPYEHQLERLCRIVDEHPEVADSVLRYFESVLEEGAVALVGSLDEEDLAAQVLLAIPRDLRPCVLAPFRDSEATVIYARQVLDFLSHDVTSELSRVSVPVLSITCELDTVAAPDRSRAAAATILRARHVELPGATHYGLYDRSQVVARLMERFFRETATERAPCRSPRPSLSMMT